MFVWPISRLRQLFWKKLCCEAFSQIITSWTRPPQIYRHLVMISRSFPHPTSWILLILPCLLSPNPDPVFHVPDTHPWPVTTTGELSNLPDMRQYLGHLTFSAPLLPTCMNGSSQVQDTHFTVVPGKASSSGRSFEASLKDRHFCEHLPFYSWWAGYLTWNPLACVSIKINPTICCLSAKAANLFISIVTGCIFGGVRLFREDDFENVVQLCCETCVAP